MSLDVYLYGGDITERCECPHCGNEHTHTERECVYHANITHNLGPMAIEAGIYMAVWRPEECEVTHARQLIEPLRDAIRLMAAEPGRFIKHNSENGWGLYENFLPWLQKYLAACLDYPDAAVEVDR